MPQRTPHHVSSALNGVPIEALLLRRRDGRGGNRAPPLERSSSTGAPPARSAASKCGSSAGALTEVGRSRPSAGGVQSF